jgi:putative hydrolase of the HAD superfamily
MKRLFDTEDRSRVFNALLGERGITETEELVSQMIQTYRAHFPTIDLYPDAHAALVCLRGQYKLGLITDGPPVSQWAKIDALNLRGRFDEIIVTSELGPDYSKPNTGAFELVAPRLGVEAPECVYVGDNPAKDFIAPNALGWTTVQIRRREGIYPNSVAPSSGMPNFTIDTLDDLDEILSRV